jgi:hypothetical protein
MHAAITREKRRKLREILDVEWVLVSLAVLLTCGLAFALEVVS